jgi:hypothetical protein
VKERRSNVVLKIKQLNENQSVVFEHPLFDRLYIDIYIV